MAKQKGMQEARKPSPAEKLGLRVSAMINSPIAQLGRRVTIHRLDDDPQEAWDSVMEMLAETDGLNMVFNDDGTVTLEWEKSSDDDQVVEGEEVTPILEDAPF
ncbi:DUF1654 domain-containing protein [Pseudomonas sp. KSR10]|uniref:DUF1654 domain-containing protein n=1 Tax=Pseudomonas sp. KSR10 TaxID=2916654 RepID=UPI001EF88F4C|nr:DUF1654 domain-containing protein [Pseudomonas sp. KSR10]MCG6540208.1 DUF1654 domain-containing protein [Pseudomonas sp. KSR10]